MNRIGAVAAAVAAADVLTKAVAFVAVEEGTRSGPLLPLRNPDALLGIAPGSGPALAIAAAALLVAFGAWCVVLARSGRVAPWVAGAFIGGAAANLADRVAFGAVHDWLVVGVAVVDLADLAVFVAVLGYAAAFVRPRVAVAR